MTSFGGNGIQPSPSSRRAWIEIFPRSAPARYTRSPSSRRAWIEIPGASRRVRAVRVALLAEGVDRNELPCLCRSRQIVALLAEGVDRNPSGRGYTVHRPPSPSSRRAWIEISELCAHLRGRASPSSRRAWIEILYSTLLCRLFRVALLAEGVDRNFWIPAIHRVQTGQSPSSRRAWIEMW